MSTVTPQIATDTWTVFSREVKPLARDPFQVVFSMIQPLVFLGLFAPLLGDLPGVGTGSSLQWFVPGVLVMLSLFGTSTRVSSPVATRSSNSRQWARCTNSVDILGCVGWRNRRIYTSFEVSDRASRAIQPNSRKTIKYSSRKAILRSCRSRAAERVNTQDRSL